MKENDLDIKKHRRFIWTILFIGIALLSVWAVISQNKNFSFKIFIDYILSSKPGWMIVACLSMLLFIISEGWAITSISKSFGVKVKKGQGYFYSAADIYFSAITPSATGGQPASAYLMMKDGLPGSVVSLTLLFNLMMYTLTLVVLGIITIILFPSVFNHFGFLSKLVIGIGFLFQIIIVTFFLLILFKKEFLEKILKKGLNILNKIHLIRAKEEKEKKLNKIMKEYGEYADVMKKKKVVFLKAFLFNLLQRVAQISITAFVFLASGGEINNLANIIAIMIFTTIGAYCIPIPGGVGVTDYLMLDGFRSLMTLEAATHLELLSRSLSFYLCILVCGLSVLLKYYLLKRREVK